jgi:hypothetical protein
MDLCLRRAWCACARSFWCSCPTSGGTIRRRPKRKCAGRSVAPHCSFIAWSADGLRSRFRGRDFPNYLFPLEIALHEDTSLEPGSVPHPTPWGGSPTPKRMLARCREGWEPADGRTYGLWDGWPKWVSCIKSHGEWAKQPKLRYTRARHSNSASRRTPPHPTPWGGSFTPQHMLTRHREGWGPTNGRIWPW